MSYTTTVNFSDVLLLNLSKTIVKNMDMLYYTKTLLNGPDYGKTKRGLDTALQNI